MQKLQKFWVTFTKKSTQSNLWKSGILSYSGEVSIMWLVLMMTMDGDTITPMCRKNTFILVNFLNQGVLQRVLRVSNLDQSCTDVYQFFLVFMVLRYRSHHWTNQIILRGFWYAEKLRDSWMTCISMTIIHLVRHCWDKEMIQNVMNETVNVHALGEPSAYRNNSESMVHLSGVNSGTRETGTIIYTKKEVPMQERKWIMIPSVRSHDPESLPSRISKMVTRMVRHCDQDERDLDGAVIGIQCAPLLEKAFERKIGYICTQEDWIHYVHEGSNKTRFENCLDSRKESVYIRAIQGHTGEVFIKPELMSHVLIPYNWK